MMVSFTPFLHLVLDFRSFRRFRDFLDFVDFLLYCLAGMLQRGFDFRCLNDLAFDVFAKFIMSKISSENSFRYSQRRCTCS